MFFSPSLTRVPDRAPCRSGEARNKAASPRSILRHDADRFTRKQFVAKPHRYAPKPGQHHIVASGYLQDQDLTFLMVRTGEQYFAVRRGDHLGAAGGGIGKARDFCRFPRPAGNRGSSHRLQQ